MQSIFQTKYKCLWLWVMLFLPMHALCADDRDYLCELGLQGGIGYYVGDAVDHIFTYPHAAYGVQFRYKFDSRWALQVKGQGQKILFPLQNEQGQRLSQKGSNYLINTDVVGEFNFFRFGGKQYDSRIKPITPYIFLGVGLATYSEFQKFAAYIPFGFGMKWKFSQWCGLQIAWQHNFYFVDNLENKDYYNNTHKLNGSNILKNDLTSSLTVGIVFEFARGQKKCRTCND